MGERLNILWLPGWFPSKVDFLSGDFIERHACAVSEQVHVTVIYVVKDAELKNSIRQIVKEETGRLTIYRGYYAGKQNGNTIDGINSIINYYKLLFTLWKLARKEREEFDLCHLHVPLRQSLLATWLKWKHGLHYVISEQNSWYMPGDARFFRQSYGLKKLIKKVYNQASAVHVVSRSLGEELNKNVCLHNTFTVIPNVVNTDLFKLLDIEKTGNKNTVNFIAVTGDTRHKNTDGIINAFNLLIKNGADAKLHIAGPNINELIQLTDELNIKEYVVFYGAVSNARIAALMQQSNAMIFFTRYETFGCVMAESLCCGVPVIASRIAVLEENLTEKRNALFVEPENQNDLAEKLMWFIQNKSSFDKVSIAATAARKYNYHTVSLQFLEIYKQVLIEKNYADKGKSRLI